MEFPHHLKITIRALVRQKSNTVLNICGLAIGLAVCLLTLAYVKDELKYDTHHREAQNVLRLVNGNNARTPGAAAVALEQNFPEVASTVRLRATRAIWLMQYGDRSFHEEKVYWTEGSLFDVFTVPLLKGNPDNALDGVDKVVISESIARKYFGEEDPIGKVLKADNTWDFTVTGIMEDFPVNSHFKSGFFLSFGNELGFMDNWWNPSYYTYVRLNDQNLSRLLSDKFQVYVDTTVKPGNRSWIQDYRFSLQPMTTIHLHSRLLNELEVNSSMVYVYTLVSGTVILLLIACINFINLSMVHSADRMKEVGLMKVLGADRIRIVRQYMTGSMMITVLVLIAAILLACLALPSFNWLTGKTLSLSLSQDTDIWLGLIGVSMIVGLVSGGIPALVVSGIRPLDSLGSRLTRTIDFPLVKRILIIAQFSLSMTLIISTGVAYDQLRYLLTKPQGFDGSNVVKIPLVTGFFPGGALVPPSGLKDELLNSPGILSASFSNYVPALEPARGMIGDGMVRTRDENSDMGSRSVRFVGVEHDYIKTLGLRLIQGRFLQYRELTALSSFSSMVVIELVLNETAVRHLGWTTPESAIDQTLDIVYPHITQRGRIVGVVEDAHFRSSFQPVEPMIFTNGYGEHLMVRLQEGNAEAALGHLQRIWQSRFPEIPFVYSFLEDDIDRLYAPENRLGLLIGICTLLATVLTFLGLFNLVSLTTKQRTKEIGIRKIVGATLAKLVQLISRQFVVLAGIASLVAWPLAFLATSSWLQDFAYRTSPSPVLFILVSLGVTVVVIATVVVNIMKVVPTNPVESLRYE